MKTIRITALLLAFVMLFSAVSCMNDPAGKFRGIVEDGQSAYKIVYANGNEAAKASAESLSAEIKNATNVEIPVVSDAEAETEYEILVGKSSRKDSTAEKRALNYSVKFNGTKLVISAGSDDALKSAVDVVIEQAVKGKTAVELTKDSVINYAYVPANVVADKAENVVFVPEDIFNFMKAEFSRNMVAEFAYGKEDKWYPIPLAFAWDDNGDDSFTFVISESSDFADKKLVETKDAYVYITNLKSGTEYFWKVLGANGAEITEVRTFKTSPDQPRTLTIDGVRNTRDIGGYITTDGKRVKQGLVYRTATLNNITESGMKVFVDELGIKTEIDLRDPSDGEAVPNQDLIDRGVKYYNHQGIPYMNIYRSELTERREEIRKAFELFADPANYPIAFHCAIGTDRTGALAMILESLLGMQRDDIYREYQLSYFFQFNPGEDDDRFAQFHQTYDRMKKGKFNGNKKACDTVAENAAAYLMEIGVTAEQIESIRSILLEDVK